MTVLRTTITLSQSLADWLKKVVACLQQLGVVFQQPDGQLGRHRTLHQEIKPGFVHFSVPADANNRTAMKAYQPANRSMTALVVTSLAMDAHLNENMCHPISSSGKWSVPPLGKWGWGSHSNCPGSHR